MTTERPPLLFVHGAWHASWCWDEHFTGHFADLGYEVHTVDLRGHRRDAGPARLGWHSVADYVADVREAVAAIGRPPVIVAHSMGGFVLQKYLEADDCAGAVLVASVPPRGVLGVVLGLAKARPRDLLRSLTTFDLYPIVAGPEHTRAMFYSAAVPETEIINYSAALGNESYRAFLDMMVLKLPRTKRIRGKVPMLVLGGELDRVFPPAVVRATGAAYGTEPVLFTGMAHNLMLDVGWEDVAATISGWLSDR
ncbi:MAG TPA: alpha/beta fold hydrolase [Marmoricola sp.]|jgi:pimeloyl-ACP methyl ester carboxylesterase|nr:alpha/beta fold hydrolase [Marmoricola sp.]